MHGLCGNGALIPKGTGWVALFPTLKMPAGARGGRCLKSMTAQRETAQHETGAEMIPATALVLRQTLSDDSL